MRVLWFTSSPCGYIQTKENRGYNGCGWMGAIESEIKKCEDIELGVCFPMDGQTFKANVDNVTYYPIRNHKKTFKDKIIDAIKYNDVTRDRAVWGQYIRQIDEAVADFKPDVIEIFGSEVYIQLAALTARDIPKILHIQGVLNPIFNTLMPYSVSIRDYYFADCNPINIYKRYMDVQYWKRNCYREQTIISNISFFLGRTRWDERIIQVLNPEAKYYYGEEILRSVFYEERERKLPEKLTIVTTISAPFYKGYDLVLKTAHILKNRLNVDFCWKVFGNVAPTFIEKMLKLKHENLNVSLEGVVDADRLKSELMNCTLYVHTSYIEDGCNSIIEAQLSNCTSIANYVGGLPTTISDGETGYLVPSNDPFQTAYLIQKLYRNPNLNLQIGRQARVVAMQRHDKKKIVDELIKVYKDIIYNNEV